MLANWVYRLGINANWLLTGEGPMFMDQVHAEQDPMLSRVAELLQALRTAGAVEAEVLHRVQDMLEHELARLDQTTPEPAADAAQHQDKA